MKELHYFVIRPGLKVPGLSLFEAELYSSAVVVQQLIGNLVYHSNRGQYEPRLALSWSTPDPRTWTFVLRSGLVCENGEKITPASFRASLLRGIKQQERKGGALIFKKLEGFDGFISGKGDLSGIIATKDELQFRFITPVRTGVLETLSYAPYGYLCSDNFKSDENGTWADDAKFISSGPYEVESIEIGKEVVLRRRTSWPLEFYKDAPEKITFKYELSASGFPKNTIIDAMRKSPDLREGNFERYDLVRDYLGATVLGNIEDGYFSDASNREAFKELLLRNPLPAPAADDLWETTNTFYPEQKFSKPVEIKKVEFKPLKAPLRIQAKAPPKEGGGSVMARILQTALLKANLAHVFVEGDDSYAFYSDKSFDIRLFTQSVGIEAEPWPLEVVFCSPLSYGFPDPTKNICKLVDEYNAGALTKEQVAEKFFRQIEEDNLIFPAVRLGITLYLSESIDKTCLTSGISVPRFDQLSIL